MHKARVGLLLLAFLGSAHAEPMFRAEGDNTVITLHSEACALEAVANLPRRATWLEGGKTIEGCWQNHPFGLVILYFADKTVVLVPTQAFTQVTGS